MKKMRVLIAAGILLFSLNAFRRGDRPMRSFQWLLGKWESERRSGLMQESWRQVDDSSMAGISSIIQPDGSSRLMEEIELVYRMQQYYYIVSAPAQNGGDKVSFRISRYADTGFIAENPQHDFPRRIQYRRVNTDSILATIDGGDANPDQKVDFGFRRAGR